MTDNDYVRSYGKPVMMGHNMFFGSTSYYVHTNGAANFSTVSSSAANIATLNATNVNVTNNLRANHYDLQTVAQLGGSFYVSPTVKFPNSGTTLKVEKSGSTLTLTITDSSITSTTMAGVVWSANSRVKVSGTINGVVTGTMDGTVSSINTSSHVLTLSVSGENSASVVAGTYTASQFSDLTVMIYQRRDGSNDYRVGIWMNCYDVANSSSTIRIYGGSDANPNVMLGNLTSAGLGTVNNLTPTGWGLFAQNAFLHGKVVANGGLIGNWTIGTTGMYYNSDAPGSTSITMIPGGTAASTTSIGGSSGSKQWIFTGKNLFGIDTTGKLYASSAEISGKITATSGSLATGMIIGNANGYHAVMDSDSFDVLNGSTTLATFGETAVIGNMSARGISINSNGFKFNNKGNTNFYIGVDVRAGQQEHLSNYYNISTSSTSQQIDGKKYYLLTSVPSDATVIEVGNSLTLGDEVIDTSSYRYKDWVVNQNKLWLSSEEVDSFGQDTVAYIYTQPITNTSDPYCVIGKSFYTNSKIAGNMSLAQGYGCLATGAYSTAIGWQTIASGMNSLACGLSNEASGRASHAEGSNTTASGEGSHAEGSNTTASGQYSHAEGDYTIASEFYSHAEGDQTTASGRSSHAEGQNTTASGRSSHAEGQNTTASGRSSHAEGYQTTASEQYSHAEGGNTTASGQYSHAEGGYTIASQFWSHAEGENTTASGFSSHAEGYQTTASGNDSHAEGYFTTASALYSHAEGYYTTASNPASHAEGGNTTASGQYSHAEGENTIASGWDSHAGGLGTVALHDQQFVIGKYNKATVSGSGTDSDPYTYTNNDNSPFIIGNGSSNNSRSNAFTVDWSGNVWAAGSVQVAGNVQVTGKVMAANTSHIGMIIMSTTLNTMAKVIAIYGGTYWIQHLNYMLYGAITNVTANHAAKDGGESTHTLTVNEMPSHSHKVRYTGGNANGIYGGMPGTTVDKTPAYNDLILAYEGGGKAHNNMPPYKNVYIWERTK